MSVKSRRALVDCVVLSLRDPCVFYPCCKSCFSKIDVEQQNTTRCRCSRCGYSCLRDQVEYRYRLSLKVARDRCIFGITVFGTCLNPFFGIHASGLQRLVENPDEPAEASTRSSLLLKAVEDCFIGLHFIFGIKLTETESVPWSGASAVNGSSNKDTFHFIASQMILPKASGLRGCTVVSYYQILLQKTAQSELVPTDPGKTSRPPATTLLLLPRPSPSRSFNNSTAFSQSLLRSQHQDSTLTPTPPWQQSLGLITSSAEQQEGCSSQDSQDESSRLLDNFKTPHHAKRKCLEDQKVTEKTCLSPPLSLDCSPPSFAKYSHLSIEKASSKTPIPNMRFSPSLPGHNRCKGERFSTRELSETFLPTSLAWDDLPFSESLSAFLCDKNNDFDGFSEAEAHFHAQNEQEARNNLENISQDKNSSIDSSCDSHSRIFQDITNTPAPKGGDRHDLPGQVCESPAGCVNKSRVRNIPSHECDQDEKVDSLSFENEEEEQLEGEAYDCSADLFSSSLTIDVNTDIHNTHAETVRTITEACSVHLMSDEHHLRNENASHSVLDEKIRKSSECSKRDSLIPPGPLDHDFIPPSQSTPIVKVSAVSRLHVSSYRTMTLGGLSLSLCKSNGVCANQPSQCDREPLKENLVQRRTSSRHSPRFTPKRRFWKPGKHRNRLWAQEHQRGFVNTDSTAEIKHKCDSCDHDGTVCESEGSGAIFVPPTPAAKTQHRVKPRRRRQTDDSSNTNCKQILLDQTLTSPIRDLAQTGNVDCCETVDMGSLDSSNCHLLGGENEACDWSKDLFSDSI